MLGFYLATGDARYLDGFNSLFEMPLAVGEAAGLTVIVFQFSI